MTFLFISGAEIVFIFFIILMVFGADKIPDIARALGKGIRQVKDATNEIKSEINDSAKNHGVDADLANNINKEIKEAKESIDEVTGPIKRGL